MARAYVIADDELHTIIAALRYYQQQGLGDPDKRSLEIHELATDGGEQISLGDDEIDALVMSLNLPDAEGNDIVVQENPTGGWVSITGDNTVVEHTTEEEACAVQRGWRMALGMDPMTGEYL